MKKSGTGREVYAGQIVSKYMIKFITVYNSFYAPDESGHQRLSFSGESSLP
jgi:hypothetical protein